MVGDRSERAVWVWLIEAFSIATAASFLASSALLWLVFSTWHLDFFSLATPGDVLMSGLSAAFRLLPFAVLAWIYWRYDNLATRRNLVILAVVLLGIYVARVLLLRRYVDTYIVGEKSAFFEWYYTLHMVLPGTWVVVAAAAAIAAAIVVRLARSGRLRGRKWIGFGLAACAVAAVGGLVGQLQKSGFQPAGVDVLRHDADCFGHALWIGERFTVLRCTPEEIRVVRSEGLSLSARGPKPPRGWAYQKTERDYRREYRQEREDALLARQIREWRLDEERKQNALGKEQLFIADPDSADEKSALPPTR
ncbi:hypothetical protein SAMN05428974_0544 [Sphingopyxis sp. YR583]|uniref:hypothetical protein n=1 Tax=Sphingopyxis sp. YR583 TaxID=1881047 RepID=UPI0008A7F556|nr:hypothetical protein [Sphingopyxis sp. YR583]SEH12713.1 hypothetical protein SAMN05428974_0544 [Sphingopyxis sp. YR583]